MIRTPSSDRLPARSSDPLPRPDLSMQRRSSPPPSPPSGRWVSMFGALRGGWHGLGRLGDRQRAARRRPSDRRCVGRLGGPLPKHEVCVSEGRGTTCDVYRFGGLSVDDDGSPWVVTGRLLTPPPNPRAAAVPRRYGDAPSPDPPRASGLVGATTGGPQASPSPPLPYKQLHRKPGVLRTCPLDSQLRQSPHRMQAHAQVARDSLSDC